MDYSISDMKQKYTKYMSLFQANPSNKTYKHKVNKYRHYLQQGGTDRAEVVNNDDLIKDVSTNSKKLETAITEAIKKARSIIQELNAKKATAESKAITAKSEAEEKEQVSNVAIDTLTKMINKLRDALTETDESNKRYINALNSATFEGGGMSVFSEMVNELDPENI